MRVLQLSTAVPEHKFSTEELIDLFPCELAEGVRRNVLSMGVSNKHLINHHEASSKGESILTESAVVDLCVQSSQKALENANLSPKDIGYFVMTYDVSPFLCPGLGQLVIRKLGFNPYIEHVNAQGLACSAFPESLRLAKHYLAANPDRNVLICVSGVNSYWFWNQVQGLSEVMEISQINRIKNKTRKLMELRKWIAAIEFFLFGDGVASIIIGNENKGWQINEIVDATNLGKRDYLAGYARLTAMNQPFTFGLYSHLDRRIPDLGLKYVSAVLKRLFGKNWQEKAETVAKWAVHTGSEKIINLIAKQHNIPQEKIKESYQVLKKYGNLAGASLPFILKQIVSENRSADGDTVLMLGYGWGFSASAALLEFRE